MSARWAGLQTRVTVAISMFALLTALVVSIPTYVFASNYLLEQRENSSLSRALVNTNVVEVALSEGDAPAEALAAVPTVGDSQPMLFYDAVWYTQGVSVTPEDLPMALLQAADPAGAMQRFELDSGEPYFAVATPVTEGIYVEAFPLTELNNAIRAIGLLLAGVSVAAMVAGALLGRSTGRRILRPLREISETAHEITEGNLGARLEPTEDPDLQPIAQAFNEMTSTVEDRLEREARFSANVSHELRSPLTGILGTAELLEGRLDQLPPREATLVSSLAGQVRRFSTLVLDLLELSRIGGDQSVQVESVDVCAAMRSAVSERGSSPTIVRCTGDAAPPSIRTDRRRLERVVANLIDNADSHGEGVSAVIIESGKDETMVHVDDSGPGVSAKDRERIFEPFNRGSKTDRKGSGLGLAIVDEQARLLGATVTVSQSPTGGARFTLHLNDLAGWLT